LTDQRSDLADPVSEGAGTEGVEYVQRVSRSNVSPHYWFDLLIALLAIVAMLDVVLGRGSSGAPTTTCGSAFPRSRSWCYPCSRGDGFRLPDGGVLAFGRGISFVDPLLIPYPDPSSCSGWRPHSCSGTFGTSGGLASDWRSWSGAAATLVYNIPGHSVDQLVFIPVDFAVAWVAGVAVRARAEQAEWRSHVRHRPSTPCWRSACGFARSCMTLSPTT